jgi:uncharacterized membrane protein YdjX (TVP38/TMEM64 family)
VFGVVCAGAWLLVSVLEGLGGPESIRDAYGLSRTWLFVPVHAVVAVSPFPGEVVAVVSSAVHGFWLGSVLNWIGWMLAAFLEYSLVRWTVREVDVDERALPNWIRRFPSGHPVFLIVGRLLPYGGHLINGAAGAGGVSLGRFTWTAAIGTVPGAVGIAAFANGLVAAT